MADSKIEPVVDGCPYGKTQDSDKEGRVRYDFRRTLLTTNNNQIKKQLQIRLKITFLLWLVVRLLNLKRLRDSDHMTTITR